MLKCKREMKVFLWLLEFCLNSWISATRTVLFSFVVFSVIFLCRVYVRLSVPCALFSLQSGILKCVLKDANQNKELLKLLLLK